MKEHYSSPSIFDTYNAVHILPQDIAQTFVPPDNTFSKLATFNNQIISGPRGSGKTTLLKMLTLPALSSWRGDQWIDVQQKVDFLGIFIAADRSWSTQLSKNRVMRDPMEIGVGTTAFTTHVLSSLVRTISEFRIWSEAGKSAITQEPVAFNLEQEEQFANLVSEVWKMSLRFPGLEGLKLGCRERLADLKSKLPLVRRSADQEGALLELCPFTALNYRECVKYGIEAYETVSGSSNLKWGFLFDEFELAPDYIQKDVVKHMRGDSSGNIVTKLALAPYNENFMSAVRESDSGEKHDFDVIDLCYPKKDEARSFSEKLFQMNLVNRNITPQSPNEVLGKSDFHFREESDFDAYGEDGYLTKKYDALSKIDASFNQYLKERKIDLNQWEDLEEKERAPIRKLRSIVIVREYFRSKAKNASVAEIGKKTSRKIDTIYAGAPTIFALCEGNPRIFIGLMAPIFQELKIIRQSSERSAVGKNIQAEQIRLSVNSFRALLKTIVYDQQVDPAEKGLLRLLDEIGHYFHQRCVTDPFSSQPHLSFSVPSNVSPKILRLIGRALNMGAIIYLPDRDADPILTSLKGKRFRLSYLLSAYYRLPIMINSSVSLSKITAGYEHDINLAEKAGLGQIDLFDDYEL